MKLKLLLTHLKLLKQRTHRIKSYLKQVKAEEISSAFLLDDFFKKVLTSRAECAKIPNSCNYKGIGVSGSAFKELYK